LCADPNFLISLVEFLKTEIGKFPQNQGLFKNLACKGYYDSTIDRLVQSINDLICIYDYDKSMFINLNYFF